ncbi:MAG: TlpA family protein disulfide reductase [Proteobacteria bacterium]|nr:TlpA family protein disulfide reductase [Pseudomonadota bacterium]
MKMILSVLTLLALMGCQSHENDSSELSSQPEDVKTPVAEKDRASSTVTAEGKVSPLEFNLTNLSGEVVKASAFRGKWLVLNYWATWCAPCRDEIPELVQFQKDHENVQILGIAYEDASVEKLQNFAADFAVNYPLLTMDIYNPPAFAAEGGLGLPTTIVYNPEGMRHKKHMGPIDYKGLQELIK